MKQTLSILLAASTLILLAGCGGGESGGQPAQGGEQTPGALSAHELEHGIGPIDEVTLGEIDSELAARGEEVFTVKCSACHRMGERYVGPALADVTTRRTPEFIMNMILNPEEMIQRHPEARALLAQFMTPMANQNLTEDEARAVLEFLRTQADDQPAEPAGM